MVWEILSDRTTGSSSSGVVIAAPFDAKRIEVTGPPAPLLSDVLTYGAAHAFLAVSTDGTVAYLPKPPPERDLVFIDLEGNVQPIVGTRPLDNAHISLDGQRIAVDISRSLTWRRTDVFSW